MMLLKISITDHYSISALSKMQLVLNCFRDLYFVHVCVCMCDEKRGYLKYFNSIDVFFTNYKVLLLLKIV